MEFAKVVFLGLACLSVNIMMVTSVCKVAQGEEGFNWPGVEGKWNIGLGNKLVLDTYYNHHVFVIKVFDDKTTINGTVKQLPSAGGSTIAFNGGWKIPKNRSSTFVTGFSKDMEMFNGTYTIVSTDQQCYSIIQGCPNEIDKEVLFIIFREEEPKEECIQKAVDAFNKLGFNRESIYADPTFNIKFP